jgi:hypothetical protein
MQDIFNKSFKIYVSTGELIDKLTILEIKSFRIKDKEKKKIIQREMKTLMKEYNKLKFSKQGELKKLMKLKQILYDINDRLWKIEDRIRELELKKDFGSKFINFARSVYKLNDKRSEIKNRINLLTFSKFQDIKQYSNYS